MTFYEIKKRGQLDEIAEWFAVDISSARNADDVRRLIEEEGVTYEMYIEEKTRREGPQEPEVVEIVEEPVVVVTAPVEKVVTPQYLVKMTRRNSYYQTYGKVFTQEHPFAICDDRTARNILEKEEGFRIATPSEAESFYG